MAILSLERLAQAAFSVVAAGQSLPPGLNPIDLAWAMRSESLFNERDADYEKYQDYYDGRQPAPQDLTFGSNIENVNRGVVRRFSGTHNYCARAVDVLVERLDITGLEAGDADLEAAIWSWWEASAGPELQNVVHTQALVKGDAFLMVDYDAEREMPRFCFHDALTVAVVYDTYHQITTAFRRWDETWYDDKGQPHIRGRLTKYTPALIEKYANEGRGWVLWQGDVDSDGQSDGGVIVWVDNQGEPLGVPVVHFANKARGQDFGRSDLVDLIPAQDEVNRRIWFTSEAMSYQGAQQVAVVGAQPPATPWVRSPGTVWNIAAQGQTPASVFVIPAGDVAALEAATQAELKRFAELAAVPLHLLSMEGNPPSGEALKVAEAPIAGKAADRITTFTPPWMRAFTLALKLANTFGAGGLPDDAVVSPVWGSVYTRSALTDAQTVALEAEDLPWEERMKRRGYDAVTTRDIRVVLEEEGTRVPGGPDMQAIDEQIGRLTAAVTSTASPAASRIVPPASDE